MCHQNAEAGQSTSSPPRWAAATRRGQAGQGRAGRADRGRTADGPYVSQSVRQSVSQLDVGSPSSVAPSTAALVNWRRASAAAVDSTVSQCICPGRRDLRYGTDGTGASDLRPFIRRGDSGLACLAAACPGSSVQCGARCSVGGMLCAAVVPPPSLLAQGLQPRPGPGDRHRWLSQGSSAQMSHPLAGALVGPQRAMPPHQQRANCTSWAWGLSISRARGLSCKCLSLRATCPSFDPEPCSSRYASVRGRDREKKRGGCLVEGFQRGIKVLGNLPCNVTLFPARY